MDLKKEIWTSCFPEIVHTLSMDCVSLNKSTSYPSKKKRQILITINGCLTLKLIISASLAQRSESRNGEENKDMKCQDCNGEPCCIRKSTQYESEKMPPRERMTFPASQKCPHFISNDLILVETYISILLTYCKLLTFKPVTGFSPRNSFLSSNNE